MGTTHEITVIGGGLAGSEAAWQIAKSGFTVGLYEMRPVKQTAAHQTADLAELVCSNSLGSTLPDRAAGILKYELKVLGSFLLSCAEESRLPAGSALAVDRDIFSKIVTNRILENPRIDVIREERINIPSGPVIISTGPLTSPSFSQSIEKLAGEGQLFFFDAIAPIVSLESIDMSIAFRASRFGAGEADDGDYINCPFDQREYENFVRELSSAKRIELVEADDPVREGVIAGSAPYFEGCLPVEVIAERGMQSLAFGPMRSVGIISPYNQRKPYAVVQLRQDNLVGDLYNMVGFQTNLTFSEQERIFRRIPGLGKAKFVRLGQMHRNTYIAAPKLLNETMQFRDRPDLFFAGQITGVEGYVGSIATGLLAGRNIVRHLHDKPLIHLPRETMLGSLCHYITHAEMKVFQPMKSNLGILPPLNSFHRIPKKERNRLYAERAKLSIDRYLGELE
jgi:methylenetetrahydrofolate--tRNA-(uracil-5-)-methyltransferase